MVSRSWIRTIRVVYLIIALGVMSLIIWIVNESNLISGDWVDISTHYMGVLPFLFGIGLAMWWLAKR